MSQGADPDLGSSLFGTNPLSPATRGPSVRAGRELGRDQAAGLARFWL
jgi:hypothetical protein